MGYDLCLKGDTYVHVCDGLFTMCPGREFHIVIRKCVLYVIMTGSHWSGNVRGKVWGGGGKLYM